MSYSYSGKRNRADYTDYSTGVQSSHVQYNTLPEGTNFRGYFYLTQGYPHKENDGLQNTLDKSDPY